MLCEIFINKLKMVSNDQIGNLYIFLRFKDAVNFFSQKTNFVHPQINRRKQLTTMTLRFVDDFWNCKKTANIIRLNDDDRCRPQCIFGQTLYEKKHRHITQNSWWLLRQYINSVCWPQRGEREQQMTKSIRKLQILKLRVDDLLWENIIF